MSSVAKEAEMTLVMFLLMIAEDGGVRQKNRLSTHRGCSDQFRPRNRNDHSQHTALGYSDLGI